GETAAEPLALPAAPSAVRFDTPAPAAAPRLIKAGFIDNPSKEPPYLQQDVKRAPEQISKVPEQNQVVAPAPKPRPGPRPTPRPRTPSAPDPAPPTAETPIPKDTPSAAYTYRTLPPAELAALGRTLAPGAAAGDADGRGAAAACSWDGAVCIATDGMRLGALTTDGGRRFFPANALRTSPAPTVEKIAPRRYVVHGLLARGGPEASILLRIPQVEVVLNPAPGSALGGQFQRVGGDLYHSGADNPLLALFWSNPALRRQVTGGGCHAFPAAPGQPLSSGDSLCAGLLTGGRMLLHRQGAAAPVDGEAWSVTLKTAADLTSVVFLDAEHGYVSTDWVGETPPQLFETRDQGRSWSHLKYDALPAPWTYLTGSVFLFAFVGAAGGMLRRREAVAEGIEAAGVSDLPIGWADPDPLKLKPVAMALSRFVRNSQTKPPLTIAISGVWGSGKSSLMNLVYEDLQGRRVRPVWFNAWHHQKEDHLLAALLENVRNQATPPLWTASGLNFRLRLMRHRGREVANAVVLALLIVGVAALLVMLGLDKLVADAPAGEAADAAGIMKLLVPTLGLPTGILAVLGIAGFLAKRMGLAPAALLASLKGNASLGELSGQLSFRHRFAREFEDATQALRVGADAGLVIFIDDLDRCAPPNLMEILEAVNFLASGRAPVFIFLGMDEDRVVKAVATQPPIRDGSRGDWGDSDRIAAEEQARLYLHKLINVTVPVPEATLEGTLGLVDGQPPPPQPVWGPRLLRWARAAPDVVTPLAVAALLLIWVGAEVADASARQMAKASSEAAAATAPTSTAPVTPAANSAAAGPVVADGATPAQEATGETSPQSAAPQGPAPTPGWVWAVLALGPLVVGLIIAALLLARRAVVVAFDQEEDSERFREALQIWHPLVFLSDRTPRGVKRHQNRLRLKAMRLRPVEPPDAGMGRLLGPAGEAPAEKVVPDEMLVALEALRQAEPGWLEDALAGRAPGEHSEEPRKTQVAKTALAQFRERFPDAWPPTQDQLEAFRTLDHAFGREA
ncbi:P-loop NTPase fold protein, partial [uncultured Phenylobacterium sp.]|uniref:P-loop NTPase fold protein n=1 Tax=uncultured Phenylobacterium sp. TaxID=349273 RepID=UPI0025E19562